MPWDKEHGCTTAGRDGQANHIGEPLTVAQIRELPDRAEIVITWSGGNGPWPARVLVDRYGSRRTESLYCDLLLLEHLGDDQVNPLHRITLGWDDASRSWFDARIPQPEHIQDKIRWLRGEAIRCVNCSEPIRRSDQSSTGWTHDPGRPDRGWQGIRCPGHLCGATPPAAAPEKGE